MTVVRSWVQNVRRNPVSLVYGLLGLIEVLLAIRFIGRLLNVTAFSWLYGVSNPLIAPFKAVLRANDKILPGSQLEIYTLIALIMYGLGGILLAFALALLTKLNDNTGSKL